MRIGRLFALPTVGAMLLISPAVGAEEAISEDVILAGPTAHVSVRSDRRVTLWQRRSGLREWVDLCDSPCDRDLPIADDYHLTGAGLRASNDFKLEASPGDELFLNVRTSTKTAWEVGVIVGGAGVLTDAAALYLFIVSFLVKDGDCTSGAALVSLVAQGVCRGDPPASTLRAIALIALIPGTAAAIAGIATASSAWSTRVTQIESVPVVVPPRPLPEGAVRDAYGAPAVISLPFASGRF